MGTETSSNIKRSWKVGRPWLQVVLYALKPVDTLRKPLCVANEKQRSTTVWYTVEELPYSRSDLKAEAMKTWPAVYFSAGTHGWTRGYTRGHACGCTRKCSYAWVLDVRSGYSVADIWCARVMYALKTSSWSSSTWQSDQRLWCPARCTGPKLFAPWIGAARRVPSWGSTRSGTKRGLATPSLPGGTHTWRYCTPDVTSCSRYDVIALLLRLGVFDATPRRDVVALNFVTSPCNLKLTMWRRITSQTDHCTEGDPQS